MNETVVEIISAIISYAACAGLVGVGVYLGAKSASKEIRKAIGNMTVNLIHKKYYCDDAKVVERLIDEAVDELLEKLNNNKPTN